MLLAGTVVPVMMCAAAEWKEVGVTSQGNRVFVSDVKGRGDMRSAWIRIEYKQPMKTADGVIKSSRAKIRVNCKDMTTAAEETITYRDEAMNQIGSRKKLDDEKFVKEPAGGFGDLAVRAICSGR
jgi:hypothetical protein